MRNERGLSWLGAIGILLAGFLALVVFSLLAIGPPTRNLKERAQDLNSLRTIVGWAADSARLYATPDGRVDVYRMVLDDRELDDGVIGIFRSERADVGPSEQELLAGDYSNFPWERARLKDVQKQLDHWNAFWGIQPHDDPRPLLWERNAHREEHLVAFTDGSVRTVPEADFAAIFAAREK